MEINVDPVTPGRALEIMKDTLTIHQSCDFNIPFFLHGQPGIGKSDLVEQLAEWADMNVEIVMLSQIEAADLRGLQFIDDTTRKTVNYVPEWLPGDDDKPTIIFLDELPSAEPRLQVAAYQLLLQGRIGRWKLNRKHYVCAAGNRIDDGAVVYEMGSALADRLQHIVVVPEPRTWLEWAGDNGVHPSVMTFIQLHGHMLEQLEDQLKQQFMVGPSPRSWHRVSAVIHKMGLVDRGRVEPLVQGWVGKAVAKDFFLTVEEMAGLPDPQKILTMSDEDFKRIIPTTLPNMWGLAFSIVAYADTLDDMAKAVRFFAAMVEHGPKTEPLEDVRKMGIEMLLAKAAKKGKGMGVQLLEQEPALASYMEEGKVVIDIGKV
jgi:hypothetical protein